VPSLPFEPTAVRARLRGGPNTGAVELGFRLTDGTAFGGNVPVSPVWQDVDMPLRKLRPLWGTKPNSRSLATLAEVTAVFGAWLLPGTLDRPHWVEVESLALVRIADVHTIKIESKDAPVTLLRFPDIKIHLKGGEAQVRSVPGCRQYLFYGVEVTSDCG